MENDETLEEVGAVIQELAEEITDMLEGYPTRESLMALSWAIVEVLTETAPNREEAFNVGKTIAMAILSGIVECDDNQLCRWHEEQQLQ
jgi:hypothetical protein